MTLLKGMDDKEKMTHNDGGTRSSSWTSPSEWGKFLKDIGIPGSIAIFLVYQGATEIPKIIRTMEQAVSEARQNREILNAHVQQTEKLIRVLQWTCWNAAKDENSRRSCFD